MTAGSIVVPHIIPIRIPQPGKANHEIDTTTVVEIKSDTLDVTIYYTLDGSKPEVVKRPGFGESSTLKYSKPICLPDGKVSVKAVAVTRDGRESVVVTKLFLVEYVPPSDALSTDDKEEHVLKDHELGIKQISFEMKHSNQESGVYAFVTCPMCGFSKETNGSIAWTTRAEHASGESSLRPQGPRMKEGNSKRAPKAPCFLSSRLGLTSEPEPTSPHTLNASLEESIFNNLTNTQISRIQRETDFFRCTKCLSLRPSDPFARFCLQCGTAVPLVPGKRLSPTEGGQLGLCIHCKTIVPMNTVLCVVCEAPIGPQLQPQASLRLQDKLICQSCGTGNPAHISFCVTCETRLPQPATAVLSGQSAPPLPSGENKMVSCCKCSRVNHYDARFCDWCGAKPGHGASCLICSRCGASSHPYASFCGFCGVFMEGPSRGESHANMAYSTGGAVEQEQPSSHRSDATTWQPVPPSGSPVLAPAPGRVEQHTQTTGLFYSSSTELHRKGQQASLEFSRQDQMRDRRPLLTAISPGRGYWRKQLDHVCAHLRSYTQNNTEFRALVGEPRMGRMVSAVIEEDNYEVSLRINFVSAEHEKNKLCQGGGPEKSIALSESQNLSSVTEGRTVLSSCQTSLGNEKSGANGKTSKKKYKSLSSDVIKQAPPTKDSQLLKEVGHEGKGQISVVQQLLDEGADPVCQGADERPALVVAVVNGHTDVIPVLVQRGADINQQSGPSNNTALHEAASMGIKGLLCAETLLGCNASIMKKNNRGLNAYDLAVITECSPLVSLLAARMGQGMLDRLVRPRTNLGLDRF